MNIIKKNPVEKMEQEAPNVSGSSSLFDYQQFLLKAGEASASTLTEAFNLILIETGRVALDSPFGTHILEAGSLLVVEASRVQINNIQASNDAVVMVIALNQSMLIRFKKRYTDALIRVAPESAKKSKKQEPGLLSFVGCDLTRMAMAGLSCLIQTQMDLALKALKLEELLILQFSHDNGHHLAQKILSACDPGTAKFREYVEANYLNDWSLDTFARKNAMSLTAFKAQFNQIYKTSPRAWINEKRLRYADELLRTDSMRIIDIAFEAGFSSQSYFTQAYKARFGCTPSEVRQVS